MFFLSPCCQDPFPHWESHYLTSLGCPPTLYWSLDLIWSYACMFLLSMSTAIRASVFSFVGALNGLLYIPYTQNLLSWLCGFNLQLVQKVGRFCVFFLSHTGPGFQLWFHCRLCMSIVHWGFLLRLPRRAWVCPNKGLGLPLAGVEVV